MAVWTLLMVGFPINLFNNLLRVKAQFDLVKMMRDNENYVNIFGKVIIIIYSLINYAIDVARL